MSLVYFIFFFHDTATTDIYTLSLHDALPIFGYSINAANKFFKSARIYASIQQVYVFTKYWGGPNPETSAQADGQGDGGNLSQGVDLSNYPVPRTWTLGVNLNF